MQSKDEGKVVAAVRYQRNRIYFGSGVEGKPLVVLQSYELVE